MAAVATWGTSWLTSWLTSWTATPPIDPELEARESRLYTNFIDEYNAATIDLVTDTIKAILVDDLYTFDSDDVYLSELSSNTIGSAVEISSGKRVADDVFTSSQTKLTFPYLTGDVYAIVLYKDTGVASTSPLISYHREDFNGLTKTMVGGDIEWIRNTSGYFKVDPENVYVGRIASFSTLRPERQLIGFRS